MGVRDRTGCHGGSFTLLLAPRGGALPAACPNVYLQYRDNRAWLVWEARIVDVLRLSNLMLVTLSSLQPFLCNGLKKA